MIETPYRNTTFLAALLETLSPATRLTIALDVTGPAERIETHRVEEWRRLPLAARTLPKTPCVFLFLTPPKKGEAPRYAPQNARRKGEGKPQGAPGRRREGRHSGGSGNAGGGRRSRS